jgi:hypothetical protein
MVIAFSLLRMLLRPDETMSALVLRDNAGIRYEHATFPDQPKAGFGLLRVRA